MVREHLAEHPCAHAQQRTNQRACMTCPRSIARTLRTWVRASAHCDEKRADGAQHREAAENDPHPAGERADQCSACTRAALLARRSRARAVGRIQVVCRGEARCRPRIAGTPRLAQAARTRAQSHAGAGADAGATPSPGGSSTQRLRSTLTAIAASYDEHDDDDNRLSHAKHANSTRAQPCRATSST